MSLARNVLNRMIVGYKILHTKESFPERVVVTQKQIVTQQPITVQTPVMTAPQGMVQQQPMFARPYPYFPGQTITVLTQQQPKPEEEKKEPKELEGLKIPEFKITDVHSKVEEDTGPHKLIAYPLIPRKPVKGEPIFALAKIYWDEKNGKYIYQVEEPKVSPGVRDLLNKVKDFLEDKLDVDFSKLRLTEAKDFLDKQVDETLRYYKIDISEDEKKALKYFAERDFIGLGKIQPLMADPNIEDISCDGLGIPIYIFHRSQDIGSVATNITFSETDELDSFVQRLAQLSGKSVSISEPLVDGSLPDGSRLQAMLATDIARKGSNFSIRKFTEEPLTPVHLLNFGTIDVPSLAYLWMAVDYGRSILVSGGTASGKTSFLNVISLFIRPDKKIVSIEDTAELRLPHPHWVPTVARTAIASEGKSGEIDMFKLLKESLRQRPDYIIVGEVRGQEAYILFQQMATGHPSLATIHAENIDKLIDRLTTPPISLPKSLAGSLDLIVFLARMRYREKFVRRVVEIDEMIKVSSGAERPTVNAIFKWNPIEDEFTATAKSLLLEKISLSTGIPTKDILDELERRMLVLSWMQKNGITEYKDIFTILNMYYYYPNRVIEAIKGEAA